MCAALVYAVHSISAPIALCTQRHTPSVLELFLQSKWPRQFNYMLNQNNMRTNTKPTRSFFTVLEGDPEECKQSREQIQRGGNSNREVARKSIFSSQILQYLSLYKPNANDAFSKPSLMVSLILVALPSSPSLFTSIFYTSFKRRTYRPSVLPSENALLSYKLNGLHFFSPHLIVRIWMGFFSICFLSFSLRFFLVFVAFDFGCNFQFHYIYRCFNAFHQQLLN